MTSGVSARRTIVEPFFAWTELRTALNVFERKQRLSHALDTLLVSFLDDGPVSADSLRTMIRATSSVSTMKPSRSTLDDLV